MAHARTDHERGSLGGAGTEWVGQKRADAHSPPPTTTRVRSSPQGAAPVSQRIQNKQACGPHLVTWRPHNANPPGPLLEDRLPPPTLLPLNAPSSQKESTVQDNIAERAPNKRDVSHSNRDEQGGDIRARRPTAAVDGQGQQQYQCHHDAFQQTFTTREKAASGTQGSRQAGPDEPAEHAAQRRNGEFEFDGTHVLEHIVHLSLSQQQR